MQTTFFIRTNGKFYSVPFNAVLYVVSRKNYCEIVTSNQKRYLVHGSITYLEKWLPANQFCRTHRSYIVSISRIESFDRNHVYMATEELPLNKTGYEKILEKILLIDQDNGCELKEQGNELSIEGLLKRVRNTENDIN